MPIITLSIPEDMKKKMESAKEINWSEVARQAISEKLEQINLLKEITKKSKLTEKDAIELGRKINKSMHRKYKERET